MVGFWGDQMGGKGPAIVIFSMLLWASGAWANLDLSIGATTRSYPLSGVLEGEAGYGLVLWGTHQASKGPTQSPWYGYIRPKIEGATAATYNSGALTLEVFPLSFVGARAGGESIQNDRDYTAYDCEAVQCRGRSYRRFFEAELALGAGSVFVQGRWRRDRWTQSEPDRGDFVDPTSGLLMKGTGDSQTVYLGLLGYNINPSWTLLAFLRYAESDEGHLSRFPFAIVNYKFGDFSLGVGGGVFQSALKEQGGSAVGFLRWEPRPSVALK